tara:strand:+ start:36624 stop:37259 length:636 start_codon:yes stop_codon:yes gene_type:complete
LDRKIAALLAKPVWHAERKALRDILLGCGLTETVKWGNLCYTDSGANIVMIHALKAYCGLSFFKGALMNDPEKVLYQRSEQMQAARLMRFTGLPAISQARGQISAFVADAVAIERAGRKVEMLAKDALVYPSELQDRIADDAEFAQAFAALTPGRRRGYVLHIAGAKQSATRHARIDKNAARIFAGKGIFDCICGLSKRMPRCDGAHKTLE